LAAARFYGILDLGYVAPVDLEKVASEMLAGGVDLIQLRAKNVSETYVLTYARRVQPVIAASGALFILNDYPELAVAAGADGVHIGQDDGAVKKARALVGADRLLGKSTHSLAQAMAADQEDVDYIGVGPLFATPTKPDYIPVGLALIGAVKAAVSKPQFCIGGVKLENVDQVLAAGAERIVIVSGLLQAPNIAHYGREVRLKLDAAKTSS
jgi:thiamine-phosphate pyrophosphorylase